MSAIKVAALSYLNTWPFLYGIENSPLRNKIELVQYTPAQAAEKFSQDEVDIALIPVGVFPQLSEGRIVTDYCIGTEKKAYSVTLLSQKPVEELTHIYLDYQSRTSVKLLQVLMKFYWNQRVEYLDGSEGYEQSIGGETGGLVIGDRSIRWQGNFPYCYDLGEYWHQLTNLPFVFASWVGQENVSDEVIAELNQTFSEGLDRLEEIQTQLTSEDLSQFPDHFDVLDYWTHYMSYRWNNDKKEGLQRFLNYLPYIS